MSSKSWQTQTFFLIQRKVVPEGFSEKSCISPGDVKG